MTNLPVSEAAVVVKSTTGMLTAAGVWSGVIVLTLFLAIAVVKVWPRLLELALTRRRDDLADLRERITVLEGAVAAANEHATAASEKAHSSEMKLVSAVAAVQLVMGELRKHDPHSPVLRHAQEMLSTAATGDFGMDRALRALGEVAGTGE